MQELAGAGLLHHALEHRVVPREGGVADLQVVAAAPSQRGHAVMGELNKNKRFTRFITRDTTKILKQDQKTARFYGDLQCHLVVKFKTCIL